MKRFFFLLWVVLFLLSFSGCQSTVPASALAQDYYNLGIGYYDQEDFTKAGEMFSRALDLDPSLTKGEYNWARALIEAKDYPRAIGILQDLLGQDPENSLLLKTLGYAYYLSGNLLEAQKSYQQVISLNPGDGGSLFNLGLIAYEQSLYSEAIEAWESFRKVSDDGKVLGPLGALYLQEGKDEGAREVWLRMDELGLASWNEYFGLGELSQKEEDWGGALQWLEKAVEKGMDRPDERAQLLFDMGVIAVLHIKDVDQSMELFSRAFSTGFKDGEQIALLLEENELLLEQEFLTYFREKGYVPGEKEIQEVSSD